MSREAHKPYTREGYFDDWFTAGLRHADTDDQGHVNHCAMLSLLETARDVYFRQSWREDSGTPSIVIAGLDVQFHNELSYPNDIRIGTRLEHAGNASLTLAQGIFAGPKCVATARAACVLIDRVTRKPRRVPDEMRPAPSSSPPAH